MSIEKTILITGCSSGIGYRAAHMLRDRGYRVFASARKREDVARLEAEGFEAIYLDLTNSASIKQAVEELLARTGGQLYGLFNNGGYGQPGAVEDLTRDVLRVQFETNVFGWLELTNLLIPVMRQQGYGRIIQNSSVLGLVSMSYRGAYNASKYAIEGLTDTLRLELTGSNIFVSLLEPGPIETEFRDNSYLMYKKYIQPEDSVHQASYESMAKRLVHKGAVAPFTLTADDVVKKVIHALESKKPKPRYYVTVMTYVFATLKRLLSSRMMDRIMYIASGGGER